MTSKARVIALLLAAVAACAPALASDIEDRADNDRFYCQERKLGTWFYCAKPKPKEAAKAAPATPQTSATERLEKITAALRELKARAILEPTAENVQAYIRFQREQLDRSSLFADVWQRALWQKPELDYTLQRPVSTLGKRMWSDQRKAEREQALLQLSQRYGLFYFFAQSCGACTIMSPIVKSLSDNYGLHVKAVSTDGGPSAVFPDYVVDSGQRQRMGLETKVTPAVVLFDSVTQRAIPVAYGVTAADDLMERILVLTQKEVGRDY